MKSILYLNEKNHGPNIVILSGMIILSLTCFRSRCRAVNSTIISIFRTKMLLQKPNTLSTSGFISDIFREFQISSQTYND